jgi:hypothetical protein
MYNYLLFENERLKNLPHQTYGKKILQIKIINCVKLIELFY